MKKIIISTAFLFIGLINLNAQNKVVYDFETKELLKITPSTLGQNTVFKIENINRFIYDVKITGKQTEYNSEPPAIFSQVFDIETKGTTDVGKVAEKVIQEQTEGSNTESVKTKSSEESFLFLNELMLDAYSKEVTEIESLPDSLQVSSKLNELKSLVKLLKTEIEKQKETIAELNKVINDEYTIIIQELYSISLNIQTSYELLEDAKVVKNKLVLISMTDGLSFKESVNKTNNLLVKYPFVNNPDKLLSSFNKSYNQFKSSYELYLVNEKVRLKFSNDEVKIKSSISSLLSEIESLKDAVNNSNYSELFQNINIFFTELKNKNNFFVVSDPVQAEKDEINFEIKITPRKNVKSSSVLETRNFTTTIPIKGGVKIDFSTGLFITRGLHQRIYSTTASTEDTSKSIISENNNNNIAQLSLGTLMHISPRWTSNFKPGFTFGLGLNSSDLTNANVFVGASAMFGTQERFIVSTGVSLANVDYVKGEYSLGKEIETTTIDSELTEKTLRAGWFISFTYNLTNKKKE